MIGLCRDKDCPACKGTGQFFLTGAYWDQKKGKMIPTQNGPFPCKPPAPAVKMGSIKHETQT